LERIEPDKYNVSINMIKFNNIVVVFSKLNLFRETQESCSLVYLIRNNPAADTKILFLTALFTLVRILLAIKILIKFKLQAPEKNRTYTSVKLLLILGIRINNKNIGNYET